jgi:hypothetical protein
MMGRIETARIEIDAEVRDVRALYEAALGSMTAAGSTEAEAEEWLGTSREPEIGNCMTELLMRGIPKDAGLAVTECGTDVLDKGAMRLRRTTTVQVSTVHLKGAEMKRINDSFSLGTIDGEAVSREEILHDGVYLSPKYAGFILRIPQEDNLLEKTSGMSREMRTIVEIAARQGATRIEFDADEEPVEGLARHEH